MKSATFTVDAALLRELGDRLIGRSYIAVAELVKNSYDADASECRIEFGNDRIVVADDGHGMTEREFRDHWMRLGTTHKTLKKESRSLHRSMTGSKGLGRLSVQFLADTMTLESISDAEPSHHLYATVDWTHIRQGTNLDTVNVQWDMRSGMLPFPSGGQNGTRIILNGLRFQWNADDIEGLGQEVWLLQPPFKRTDEPSEVRTAENFHVTVDAPNIERAKDAFFKMRNALLENWKAKIYGTLEDGRAAAATTVTVALKEGYPHATEKENTFREHLTLPLDLGRRRSGTKSHPMVDRVSFEILVFKPERKQAGGIPVRQMREYLRRFGNVSVYDGGFRLPYYGASQDWLDIATDQGRRLGTSDLLPTRLSVDSRYLEDLPAPGRILGSVEIDTNHERTVAEDRRAPPRQWLQIQPGRDRLAENVALEQLRDLVRFSLDFYASRFRLLSARSAEKRRAKEPPSRVLSRAVAVLESSRRDIPSSAYQEVRRELTAARKMAANEEERLDRRAVLLAPLATAGMTALALNHELAREVVLLKRARSELQTMAVTSEAPELARVSDDIASVARRFDAVRQLFDPLLAGEDRDATDRLRVGGVARQVVRAFAPVMGRVTFDTGAVPDELRFPVGSFAEWNAVLQNLLTNAWNAMLDTDRAVVVLEGGRGPGTREWLRVSDTGVGLDVSLGESAMLFEAFERRLRIRDQNRSISMGGQGLGLAIVRMIARRRGAEVAFVEPKQGLSTTLEISWKGARK